MTETEEQPGAAGIARAIRRYLEAHPQALNTARGIQEWWLRDAEVSSSAQDVLAVLEDLVAAGEMAGFSLPSEERVYGSAKRNERPGHGVTSRPRKP